MTELKNFTQLWVMNLYTTILISVLTLFSICSCGQIPVNKNTANAEANIVPGAERMEVYLPYLKGKKVAVFANQTSIVLQTHLIDTLLKSGVNVVKIFGPEHGFRGDADAGEHVTDAKDKKTGLPIVSLYGDHRKPTTADLKDVDVLVFDVQDVGARFYTYIGSLEYYLEAALENHKPLLILDRPNPNGFYVDGPILDMNFKSFIGMRPVPIVYGMTIGEYALMLAGEGWLSNQANSINSYNVTTTPTTDTPFHVQVIKCKNYDHNSKYILPVMPSPNLKSMQGIYLYPSTCFFEGTVFSEGRGTNYPFEVYGHPNMPKNLFAFTPKPNAGAKNSKCFYQRCYGYNLHGTNEEVLKKVDGKIQLKWFIDAYNQFDGKDSFFLKNNFIDKLTGSHTFQTQVRAGKTADEIHLSWQPGVADFKKIRGKYLLYKDFE